MARKFAYLIGYQCSSVSLVTDTACIALKHTFDGYNTVQMFAGFVVPISALYFGAMIADKFHRFQK